jgi:ankyrin repeat protein
MGLFYVKWLTVKKAEERSCEELHKFEYIFSTFVPDLGLADLRGIQLSPTGRNSEDLSLQNLELRDSEMRHIITESRYNPLYQDYRGRNGLHCLAIVVRLFPDRDIQQPLASRKSTLVDLLDGGVDVNAFDSLGATPLHTFLSYPRSHAEDSTIALFIKIMVLRDHGAELNLRDRDGNCALHLACKSGRVPCVEILVALGAKVNARNYLRCSAIAEARREMERSLPEDAARIQQCIDLVRRAGGIDDPLQDDPQCYQNNKWTEPSLIETGSFLPRP